PSTARQLVSIRAAGKLAPDDAQTPLTRLLNADDDRVRLAAARALANLGERDKVLQSLVHLLESKNARVRAKSHQSLEALTGQRIAFISEGQVTERAAAVRLWQQWIESSGGTAELILPLADQVVPLGLTLLVAGGQTLVELD